MSALLEVRGLDAGYDGVRVVRGLDLTVEEGEVVAVLGPNGAGKSTTLLTASGVLAPLAGDIRFLGEPLGPVMSGHAARRGLALVPEHRALFSSLTVQENLRAAARSRRWRRQVDEALARFPELERRLDVRAGLLSGGEQQMLVVARALVGAPRLLVVDEMSLGLAPIVLQRLVPLLRTIAEDTGIGVLFVEQYLDLALAVADRALVMRHGEVVLAGSSAELRARQSQVEAAYLGGHGQGDDHVPPS